MYMAMLGWNNTANPIIIPGLFGGIGTVFFLRQYVMGIPDDLIGAAKIDGMSEVKIFLTLIVPLSLPAITTQVVLGFIGAYNSYLDVLIYLNANESAWTIQLVLKNISGFYPGMKNISMAFCVVGMFPLIILYLALQNYILKGISMSSGLKG
jgi:multiple sugar transport system permease protein